MLTPRMDPLAAAMLGRIEDIGNAMLGCLTPGGGGGMERAGESRSSIWGEARAAGEGMRFEAQDVTAVGAPPSAMMAHTQSGNFLGF